ncbi:pseudaminic acid cytidylyltransferase [Limnohabitans sp. JirII-29]|uniref:pseudaminic acid cytidylyltransferase n=1 Tax=Limnohabitans sp. JirII-29 TaxID=1835756 RepID=UPI000D38F923|nr:pseudaminic acid cytidylyltransferase [Limnohabitans sp. JirII-29]PUE29368.1 pseudaminic acid cytidylyltransferase [Limnohabitans sp. JirII-29]
MKIAIIPARGGSQRIPRKNIRTFCGKPMIAWSIEAALHSACFERVIVSTDDADIAAVAQSCGAEVPFMRPADLSDHHTPTLPVVAHAIDWAHAQGMTPQAVCCIYATAPMITALDVQQSLHTLLSNDCDYVFAATSYAFPIQRAFQLNAQHRVEMFDPEHFGTRSQDLPHAYHDAGQFYWGTPAAWLNQTPIFSSRAMAHLLPRYRVQDIDTPEDWVRAERMCQSNTQELPLNKDAHHATFHISN